MNPTLLRLRAPLIQMGSQGAALLALAGHFAIAARLLAPREFGYYVGAQAVVAIMQSCADFGIRQTTVLKMAGRPRCHSYTLRDSRFSAVAMGLMVGILGACLLIAFGGPLAFPVLALTPAAVLSQIALPYLATREWRGDFSRLALATFLGPVVALVAMIPLAATQSGSGSVEELLLLGGTLALGSLLQLALVSMPMAPLDKCGVSDIARHTKNFIGDALPLGMTNALSIVHIRLDQLVLAGFGLAVGLAAYGVAYRAVDGALALAVAAGVVTFPLLANSRGETRIRMAKRITGYYALLGILMGTVAWIAAPVVVAVLGGQRYDPGIHLIRLLAPALAVSVFNMALAQLALVRGRAPDLLKVVFGAVAVNLVLNLALVPSYGPSGAAIATDLSETAGMIAVSIVATRGRA